MAAAASGGGGRPWEVSRCSIYRVPACIKDLMPKAYKPKVVSLGPFHHGDGELVPMEEHKRRALQQLLRRANRPLEEFLAAVEEILEELESAYMDLGAKWRVGDGRKRFLEMMVVDGCFLLEVMRAASLDGKNTADYAANDPLVYMAPYIRHDMLMLENQLPLIVLEKLVDVENAKPTPSDAINRMVLRFLTRATPRLLLGIGIGLHALDVHRRNMLFGPYQPRPPWQKLPEPDIIRSAVELYEAGIRFKKNYLESLHDIRFRNGVLSMPAVTVDDSTEYTFLNMMAFERLHVGNYVMAYVLFMNNIIHSAKDVALLSSKGIIQNAVGSDKAVAKLFNSISKNVVLEPGENALDSVHQQVNAYCQKPWNMWRANLIHTYFRSP